MKTLSLSKMSLTITLVLALLSISQAYLKVRIAGMGDPFEEPNNKCETNWGYSWYAKNCYEAIRDGKVDHTPEFKINNINESGGSPSFTSNAPGPVPFENYYVYAVADSFTVPESKEYTFWMSSNHSMWVFIDGHLLGSEMPEVWLFDNSIATNDALAFRQAKPSQFPFSNKSTEWKWKGGPKNEEGTVRDNTVSKDYPGKINLEAGKKYKLEVYYTQATMETKANFYYGPSQWNRTLVPAEWFGEQANNSGTFIRPMQKSIFKFIGRKGILSTQYSINEIFYNITGQKLK